MKALDSDGISGGSSFFDPMDLSDLRDLVGLIGSVRPMATL